VGVVARCALVLGLAGVPVLAHATPPETTEVQELRSELERFARRNAWAGVEETYQRLVTLGPEAVGVEQHMLGYRAAEQLGLTADAVDRLKAALAIEPTGEAGEALARIERTFGTVHVRGSWRRRPMLVRERLPFAPDQRASIDHARSVVAETGSFRGWLPEGEYLVGDQAFEVVAGAAELVVDVRRPGRGQTVSDAAARGAGFQRAESAVRYAGPVAVAGPGGMWSPQGAGAGSIEPDALLAGGVGLSVGGEVGFSRAFALAPSVGYQGNWSSADGAHQVTGWLAAVVRQGRLRLALGPTFGMVFQRGYGVSDSLDRALDGDPRLSEDLQYKGTAWGGGASLGVGYGMLDLDPVVGQLELVAMWQGGERDYLGLGLRFGIVPKVPKLRQSR
jgi:hypothetical protein